MKLAAFLESCYTGTKTWRGPLRDKKSQDLRYNVMSHRSISTLIFFPGHAGEKSDDRMLSKQWYMPQVCVKSGPN